jgi:hypothetical protein
MYGLQDMQPARQRIAELHRSSERVHMASQAVRELRDAQEAAPPVEPTHAGRPWARRLRAAITWS